MSAALGAIALLLAVHAAGITPAAADTAAPALPELLTALRLTPLGGRAPAFTLSDADGRQRSLADVRGQVVLLYFWASW